MRAWLPAVALVLAAGCAAQRPVPPSATASQDGLERQILVTVRQTDGFAAGLTGAPSTRYFQRRYGATPSIERVLARLAREHGLRRVDGWPIASLSVYCEVLEVPVDAPIETVIARLAADPDVDLVQPMNLFATETTRYDDPYADLQGAAIAMELEQAHRVATGRGVLIAVIDTAVDASHPDLRGRVRVERDLVSQRSRRRAEVHGTAIAGVIASAANNRQGIIGVAPDAGIAALRACWANGERGVSARCSTFSLALALETALEVGADVVNLSLAGPEDPLLTRLLDAVIARGVIVIAARPAAERAQQSFPASHPRVIAAQSPATVTGDSPFRVGAPAEEILTTTPGASYAFLSGNSLAAAHASGAVALLLEHDPSIGIERAAALLSTTSQRTLDGVSINACRALEALRGPAFCDPPTLGVTGF